LISLMFETDGDFRSSYEEAGIILEGPTSFDFDTHHPTGIAKFIEPARWARAWAPDVLWLNRFEYIFWAQAVARWSKAPIVCQLHHMPDYNRTALLSRGVAHFVAVSNFVRDVWVEAGIDSDRISVVYNALPPNAYPRGGVSERADAKGRLGIPEDVAIVLYYGRITREKGVGTLLDAWAGLGLGGEEAQLVLVGQSATASDPELDRQLNSLDPSGTRRFPMQSDVVPFLHAADLVVFPTWLEEGFGRVPIEVMATGRPVIASRVGAVPEVLSGPMERFLVEPRNPDELGGRISSLLNWRRTEPGLGEACADWVELRFPFDEHVTALEKVFLQYRKRRR
jgi:glycosyltransferase involved in cell wall biosynthesis